MAPQETFASPKGKFYFIKLDFASQNKEENPLLTKGFGFCFAKQGGKSSPHQGVRILLRKTRRIK